jgi:hypothetical protein
MIQSIPSAASSAPGGAVGGASNLTTAGAIPYVVSPGTLGQDQTAGGQLFWDATNHRLLVGTATTDVARIHLAGASGSAFQGIQVTSNASGDLGGILFKTSSTTSGYWKGGLIYKSTADANGRSNLTLAANTNATSANVDTGDVGLTLNGLTANVSIGTQTDGNFKLDIQKSGSSGTGRVYDQTATTGTTLFVVRAGAGQSGNLFNIQNNSGSTRLAVSLFGGTGGAVVSNSAGDVLYWPDGSTFRFLNSQIIQWSSDGTPSGSAALGLNKNADGNLGVTDGSATLATIGNSNNGGLITTVTRTITGAVTDGYTAGVSLTPTYTAATAQTVTRHNFINLANPVLSGAGPAALTDATVFRFDAAAGTHKAVDAGTTKITVGAVDAWLKININGTIYYVPAYTSKTT